MVDHSPGVDHAPTRAGECVRILVVAAAELAAEPHSRVGSVVHRVRRGRWPETFLSLVEPTGTCYLRWNGSLQPALASSTHGRGTATMEPAARCGRCRCGALRCVQSCRLQLSLCVPVAQRARAHSAATGVYNNTFSSRLR